MIGVTQRVLKASVVVEGEVVGAIERGTLVYVGVAEGDTNEEAKVLADRVVGLRVFPDEDEKMNLTLAQVGGSVLAVPNFTLCGDPWASRRPSFMKSAGFEEGKALFTEFVRQVQNLDVECQTGVFGAHMEVQAVCDGPVTMVIRTDRVV